MLFYIFFIFALILNYNSFFFNGTVLLLIFFLIFPFLSLNLEEDENIKSIFYLPLSLFLIFSLRDGSSITDLIYFICFICLCLLIAKFKEKLYNTSLLIQFSLVFLLNLFLEHHYVYLYFFLIVQIFYLLDKKKITKSIPLVLNSLFVLSLVFFLNFKEISFQKYYIKDFLIWISVIFFIIFYTRLSFYIKFSFMITALCISFYSSSIFFSVFSIGSYIYVVHIFQEKLKE